MELQQQKSLEFRALSILSHASFGAYLIVLVFLSFGEALENYLFVALSLIALIMYALSLRSRSLGLASASWLLLGAAFVLAFISSGRASYLGVTVAVLFLLCSHELTRFSFSLRGIVEGASALNRDERKHFESVMRSHSIVLAGVATLALVSSLVLEYASPGVVILNPPAIGVTVFVVLAVLLVAFLMLRRD